MSALALPFPPLSPEIFTIGIGALSFSLRWYALAYIAGLVIGWRIVAGLMRRPGLWAGDTAPMRPEAAEDLLTAIILGVILGGRLGFVAFYQPGHYLAHPLDILKVWEGGMAFHGGLAGVLVAGWWFARRHEVAPLALADALAVATPPGLMLGRIANFINAELWGAPTTLPWGVIFPGAAAQECGPGWPVPCARHPSQLYEAGLEGLVLGLVLLVLAARGGLRRRGLATGVFALGYGLARIAVETVRVADAQFITPDNPAGNVLALGPVGLSMGQLLSLPLVVVGAWLIVRARRRAPAAAA
ncbi:MAG: prolipoprotein diacylglyceryl transferase [Rhodobacteraceae bacterium]|nr:prolipoprotein diacylglyceryl transferase [Paracoccaceae bacterium]